MRESWMLMTALLMLAQTARAGASAPREPLLDMVAAAEFIAVVEDTHAFGAPERPDDADDLCVEFVEARVLEVIKGDGDRKVLQMPRNASWHDVATGVPALPRTQLPKPRRNIVFVKRISGRRGQLLPWGRLVGSDADLSTFRDALVEGLGILREGQESSLARVRAWQVRYATTRATRGHMLRDLVDEMWMHPGAARQIRRVKRLSSDQRRVLRRGFAKEPSDDSSFAMTLAASGDEADAEFDEVAVSVMERRLGAVRYTRSTSGREREIRPPHGSAAALALLLYRLNDESVSAVLREWSQLDPALNPPPDVLRDDWKRAKKRLALQPVAVDAAPSLLEAE